MGVNTKEKANSYANDVYPNNKHMYLKPKDALLALKYKPVDEFLVSYFQCILWQCNMGSKYCMTQD